MSRLLSTVIIIFALLGQSLAAAYPAWLFAGQQEPHHAVLHWQGEAHHHHADDEGAYHIDDSEASDRHIMADHGSSCAILHELPTFSPCLTPISGIALNPRTIPHPFLEGPLRPPRLIV